METGEGFFQEFVPFLVIQVIVFDFPGSASKIHQVRRIRQDQVRFYSIHKLSIGFLFRRISAQDPMFSQLPKVSSFGEHRLLEFFFYIKVIFFGFGFFIEDVGNFVFIESGQADIEVRSLEGFDFHPQHLFVPSGIQGHPVVGQDIGLFLSLGQIVHQDAGDFLDSFLRAAITRP